ncbi:hypothetical protein CHINAEXTREME_20570 (plasmid) [Halobiforma lacisalsi AJ5]|uniref:Uncharacterized protein n=1 Tax=Natronobacterium lacisalsi AJ5 TaxID=358396 RepID=M0LZ24_NATLA|nr:hypothetical protein [Halobiforma lacisalsi]APX00207.1 hypothetical protein CHINAEXTREME_20570 [Halobiforma lacisalsi AJ5]EMA37375.1 hypothetical protein C445_00761 [Halobiforma lacisalsi AJ5]
MKRRDGTAETTTPADAFDAILTFMENELSFATSHYSGSEAKAHPFRGGMKPTTGKQTTGISPPDIPTF